MGEVLPPKRQTVVDRLRKRLEIYRRHQSSCLPRYDQAANGIYDSQRQETLLLKQRFLEAKAKKTKRSDNRHAAQRDNNLNNGVASNNVGSNNCDNKTSLVPQSKLKRAAGSPLLDCALDGLSDSHPNKIPRNSTPDHPNNSSHHQQQSQQQQQQTGMPSFSVQIVQQFSSSTSKSPHSQTIQTNVTVQTLPGGQIKTSNSPMTTTTSSPGVQSGDGGTNILSNNPGNSGTPGAPSTSISVGTSVECKQEPPDNNFAPCSLSNNRTITTNLNSELSMHSGNNLGTPQGTTLGDRFSDSLANLGFPEDSSDDVIHPDILKDIIDDVFTNPSDLMNGFSFVDNLKDTSGGSIGDEKDSSPNSLRNVLGNNKPLTNNNASSAPLNHFQNNMGSTQFSVSQSQQSVFDFHSGGINNTANVNNVNVSQSFPQTRMSSYVTTSPNLNSMNANNTNNGALGLDFKLTEPSPAAQTLKQMAEQHQNMQQKQQQQQLGHLHPRSPFGSDSFPDPLANIRSNFLNGSPTSIMQKSPNSIFQSMGFNNANNNQQQIFPGTTPVKQEVSSPVPPIYTNMNSPPVQLADLEQLHKRRQALQMQQQQQQQPRPPFSHSPDQKSVGMSQGGGGPAAYMATRPLSHYNDPMSMGSVPSHGSASNSPVSHPVQFMRGVSTPGVTPPPPPQNFVSSPSSGTALNLSQNQQLQISQGQQLQVSQSQQQILVSQDVKPSISPQTQQQQQHVQARNFYPGHHSSVHMSQSQSVSFQFGGNTGICSPNTGQRTQAPPTHAATTAQRQMQQQYASRPPPDYQSPLDANSMNINQHQPQQTLNPQTDNRIVNAGQRGRKTLHVPQPYMAAQNQRDLSIPPQSTNNTLLMSRTTPPLTVITGVRGRGAKSNSRANVATNKQGYPRLQRPPNVNVGPEGLNISQRPPGLSTDWRHVFMQQQQQQQINTNASIRVPYSRAPMSSNYAQNMASYPNSSTVQIDPNSNVVPVSGGMSRVDHLMANNMSQMSGVPTGNVQFMMQQQQQQAMMQSGLGASSNSLLTTSQLQMSGAAMGLPVRDANQQQQNVFCNDIKPPPLSSIKLDDSSQSITDSNQFILDFLDNIDCSTSDLLNFDMPGNGSSFPLLDDMSKMLGQ